MSPVASKNAVFSKEYLEEQIMKNVYILAVILAIIGAINWGLVGLFNFDLVAMIFGHMTIATRIVYMVVGVSGIFVLSNIGVLICLGTDCKKQ